MDFKPGTKEFGDFLRSYEQAQLTERLVKDKPFYARIDGRTFSTFTRGLDKPYDKVLMSCMQDATIQLVKNFKASIGYTQSDEISLFWPATDDKPESEIIFGGKIHKLTSLLASAATSYFIAALHAYRPTLICRHPHFDCRVIQADDEEIIASVLEDRSHDCYKNAIQGTAQANFSHKELQGVNTKDQIMMLTEKQINVFSYPLPFIYGSYYRNQKIQRCLTAEELNRIPNEYRPKEDELVTRSTVKSIPIALFSGVTNKQGVMFDGEEPKFED